MLIHFKFDRFQIWKSNLIFIEEHNNADQSFKLKINQYGDLTVKEFERTLQGVDSGLTFDNHNFIAPSDNSTHVPSSLGKLNYKY